MSALGSRPVRSASSPTAQKAPSQIAETVKWPTGFDERSGATETARSAPRLGETAEQTFHLGDARLRTFLAGVLRQQRPKFVLKQEWIGRVDEVFADSFSASLMTRSSPGQVESAEIDLDEVAPGDLEKLRPGAVFYWVVGYRDEPHGQRLGVSSIIFRNLVGLDEEQLAHADARASEVAAFLHGATPARPE